MKNQNNKLAQLGIFSIAMGFLEAAVVIYLRKIYYPGGFDFPLAPIDPDIALTEVLREAATIIMLAGIAMLAGKTRLQQFAYFMYCFAVWDIFYYVFLKLLLNWPESIFTPDILFLIPVPWVGPVLAPCLVSLYLIILAVSIINIGEKLPEQKIRKRDKAIIGIGMSLILVSFMWDYFQYIQNRELSSAVWSLNGKESLLLDMKDYIPGQFNWLLFGVGFSMMLFGLLLIHQNPKS